ncbi:MAG TPA: hypothetical protein VMX75_10535 [Spirochaetia bacterium]|nr:hypothetical protein [Spirochaetia bacterium]
MRRLSFISLFSLFALLQVFPYKILYAEQFYRLYHLQFHQSPDSTMENIVWLEKALEADFCNPLYALAEIKNKEEWKHYRYLFKMHVNLKLVELYRTLGSRFDKREAYFFNAPWRRQNLESLSTAEQMYKIALAYWEKARQWADKLRGSPHHLEEIQKWEDENYRILSGELDYGDILGEQLDKLSRVRAAFEKMDATTY